MKIVISVALAFLLIGCGEDAPKKVEHSVQKDTKEEKVVVKEVQKEVVAKKVTATHTTKTGAELFSKCASCHGINAEKKALGKSQVIKGWDIAKIENALGGYKNGTYGGSMKGLMKAQVTSLSEKDITLLAKHISKL